MGRRYVLRIWSQGLGTELGLGIRLGFTLRVRHQVRVWAGVGCEFMKKPEKVSGLTEGHDPDVWIRPMARACASDGCSLHD